MQMRLDKQRSFFSLSVSRAFVHEAKRRQFCWSFV
nr:MAG TPA: hypothetical protein [Caudoviricetes sp.]